MTCRDVVRDRDREARGGSRGRGAAPLQEAREREPEDRYLYHE